MSMSQAHAKSNLLIVLSAPSGAGKTTICNGLLAGDPSIVRAVTCTTRPPRPGERDGVDYHFLTPAAFERQMAEGGFLEQAQVYGHRYGTLKREVLERLRQAQDVLLNVDVQGAASIRALAQADAELGAALVTVFLTPASVDVLAERLARRGQDPPGVVARRLAEAREEIAVWREFDYLVVSSSVAEDLRRVRSILEAEKMRTRRVGWAPGA